MIEPCGHFVLVYPEDVTESDKTLRGAKEAGIWLDDSHLKREQAASMKGTIVAIGPQAWKVFDSGDPWAKVGDKVYFPRYNNQSLTDPDTGKVYFLLSDDKVLAKYEEGTDNE